MPENTYPLEPFIGVDCSGQPHDPPMYAVATRFSRRRKQNRWIARVSQEDVRRYSVTYRDWKEKLYASLFFKVIDRIYVANYEIEIDKEFPTSKMEKKVHDYLKCLFGTIHSGEIEKENPSICFKTKEESKYVRNADKKSKWAHKRTIQVDEKKTSLDWIMKLLE